MSRSEDDDATDAARSGRDRRERDRRSSGEAMTDWLAESALRIALTIVGFVLLIYAVGRAVGTDLLAIFVDALLSPIGRWIVVAFFALLLIVVAQRGFRERV